MHSPSIPAPSLMSALVFLSAVALAGEPEVHLQRVPENGLQPSAQVDTAGRVHLIYLTGDPKAADIHYVTRTDAKSAWSAPLTVNSQPGSAVAIGTVRGPRLALGASNSVHVVWNGSSQALPKVSESSPLLYSRLAAGSSAFESQRALGGETRHLDGGAAVAANGDGSVLVIWHAALPTPQPGGDDETKRAVFVARSGDSGKTFGAPQRIDVPGTGVCACCGLEAAFRPDGTAFALYRSAEGGSERGMVLLSSKDGGQSFTSRRLDHWELTQCPMSTVRIATSGNDSLAAWQTKGSVMLARLNDNAPLLDVSGPGRRANHPVVVPGSNGRTLIAWTEGTGWQQGGSLAWQILGPNLKPAGAAQRSDGVPIWGYLAAWAEQDGGFTVLF